MNAGQECNLLVADPWAIAGETIACSLEAVAADGRSLLVRFRRSVQVVGVGYIFAVLRARDGGPLCPLNSTREVSGIGLLRPPPPDASDWGSDEWRGGGLAFIATLECKT